MLQLPLFSGLVPLPFEHAPPTPQLYDLERQRIRSAAFVLDLVDATA